MVVVESIRSSTGKLTPAYPIIRRKPPREGSIGASAALGPAPEKKARLDLAILIGLLSLEEMSEAVSGDKEDRYLASTRHNHHVTAWGCHPDEFTTTKEQGADTLPWREGGRIVNTRCLMQGTGRSFK